jgi:hypothetical protein
MSLLPSICGSLVARRALISSAGYLNILNHHMMLDGLPCECDRAVGYNDVVSGRDGK